MILYRRLKYIPLALAVLYVGGCAEKVEVENVTIETSASITEEVTSESTITEDRIKLDKIELYGASLQIGEQVTVEALEAVYDFYVNKDSYYSDLNKMLYPYETYIENFSEYSENIDENNPQEYEYSWFVLMGGQKQTGEYVGFSVYNTTEEEIPTSQGTLTNFYAILDEYSNISYNGLKYGSTVKDMVETLGDYDSFFEQEDKDYGYDLEYNYNYNDGLTYLTFKFKDNCLVSILASDIVDTKTIIDEYDEEMSNE